jgi:hypothetical protein
MHRTVLGRAVNGALVAGLALLIGACVAGPAGGTGGSSAPSSLPVASASTAVATTGAPTASMTASPSGQATITLGEGDNGRTVSVPVGASVTLVLANTYWQVQGSSDPAVLAVVEGPATSAAPMTACVPGAGCGTVTTILHAAASGRASITAARTTCGEAMRCTGTAGAYEVTVVVGG